MLMLIASDLAGIVIVIASTVIVVVAVLGLFVWGAIQDGREEKASKTRRQR
jgi:phosphotransferase system  glucose/maltose/N-acetylglucosamine-specific IIC component